MTVQHHHTLTTPKSTYVIQRSCVVVKQCRAVYAELVEDLLGMKQPRKCQQQFATPIRHINRHVGKVRGTVAETLEFPLDVNSELLCIREHITANAYGCFVQPTQFSWVNLGQAKSAKSRADFCNLEALPDTQTTAAVACLQCQIFETDPAFAHDQLRACYSCRPQWKCYSMPAITLLSISRLPRKPVGLVLNRCKKSTNRILSWVLNSTIRVSNIKTNQV